MKLTGSDCIFVSPHFDDAVLSCANLLQTKKGATVLTVFGGSPDGLSDNYNFRTTGEKLSSRQISVRKSEDAVALKKLGTRQASLNFYDSCYARPYPYSPDMIGEEIIKFIDAHVFTSIFFPLGISHEDHILVSDAVLYLINSTRMAGRNYYVYEDLPYAYSYREKRDERLNELQMLYTFRKIASMSKTGANKDNLFKYYTTQYEVISSTPHYKESMEKPEAIHSIQLL